MSSEMSSEMMRHTSSRDELAPLTPPPILVTPPRSKTTLAQGSPQNQIAQYNDSVVPRTGTLRQRSGSPWGQSSTRSMTRVPSKDGLLGSGGLQASRALHENNVMLSVKRHMEALEDKFNNQVGKIQNQHDRLREVNLTRLEEKIIVAEGMQPKLERRMAELTGSFQGISDEFQSQIRRLDTMDERWREWRHQMEEEVRVRFVESEQHIQKVASDLRVTRASVEESLKRQNTRLQRLEAETTERTASWEHSSQAVMALHHRVEKVEIRHAEVPSVEFRENSSSSAHLALLEKHLHEVQSRVHAAVQEQHENEGRLEHQEERLKALRTSLEAKDGYYRQLGERLERADVEGRFEHLQKAMREDRQVLLQEVSSLSTNSKVVADVIDEIKKEVALVAERTDRDIVLLAETNREASEDFASVIEGLQKEIAALRREASPKTSPRHSMETDDSFRRLPVNHDSLRRGRSDDRLGAGLSQHGAHDPLTTQVTSQQSVALLDEHSPLVAQLKERMDNLSEEVRGRREAEDVLRKELQKLTSEKKSAGFDDKSVAATSPEVEQVVNLVEGLRRDIVMDVGLLRTEMEHSRNDISSLAEMVVRERAAASKEASHSKLEMEPYTLQLLSSVQNCEAAEVSAHERLLTRIDELCDRITAVDTAVVHNAFDNHL